MKKLNFRSVSNQSGFTLIEILIAIFLLAFVSIGIVSVTSDSQRTKDRTIDKDRDNLQIETALSRFEWDFSQIFSPLYYSQRLQIAGDPAQQTQEQQQQQQQITPEQQQVYEAVNNRYLQMETFAFSNQDGQPVPRFESTDKSSFEFFTSSNRRRIQNQKQSNYAWVKYTLVDSPPQKDDDVDPETAGLNLPKTGKSFARFIQADDPYNDKRIDTDKLKAQILLNNVESVEFQFWDPGRLKFDSNLMTIQGGMHLLRGVKLIISWYDKTGNKRTATKIFRPLWPAVVPQDSAQAGTTTGTTTTGTGTTTGTTTTGSDTGTTTGTTSGGTTTGGN